MTGLNYFAAFLRSLPAEWRRLHFTSDAGSMEMAGAAVLLFVGYALAWLLVGRDPESDVAPIASKPPENLSPAAMRYVRFHCKWGFARADVQRTLAAAILNMAVKKYLTIEELPDGMFVLRKATSEPVPALTAEEQSIAAALFTSEEDRDYKRARAQRLDQLQKSRAPFARGLYGMLNAAVGGPDDASTVHVRRASARMLKARRGMINALKAVYPRRTIIKTHWVAWPAGLLVLLGATAATLLRYQWPLDFHDRPESGGYLFLLLFAILYFVFPLMTALEAVFPLDSFAPVRTTMERTSSAISVVTTSAVLAVLGLFVAKSTSLTWATAFIAMMLMREVFALLLRAPTELGARLWSETEGFRTFLTEVDSYRTNQQRKTTALFEQLLPYAFALECDEAWARPFAGASDPSRFTQSFVNQFYFEVSQSVNAQNRLV